MLRVVVIGHDSMLANLIAGVLDSGSKIAGVMRYERVSMPAWRRWLKDIFNPSREFTYIKGFKLHEIKAKSANSEGFRREILKLNADIILMGTWGEKLLPETFKLPKIGTINVHPSLLPKYRGSNPYLRTIWNGETQSGVTFHLVDENFDTGAILIQKTVEIKPDDTSKELKSRTVVQARAAACELLQTLENEIVMPISQSQKHATYYPQITQEELIIDFSETAAGVSSHIRAFHPWFRTAVKYKNFYLSPNPYQLEILENSDAVGKYIRKDQSLTMRCADGKFIKMSSMKLI